MRMSKWGLICGALLIAGTAWAAGQMFSDKAESSIQIQEGGYGGLEIHKKEVKYLTGYLPDYLQKVLIKVTTDLKNNTAVDGVQAQSVIEARSQSDFFAAPIWTVTNDAQEVAYENDYLIKGVRYGCCGDSTRSTLYNVANGKSPATYLDEDFYTISVPNTQNGNRYMAQIDDPAAPRTRNGKDYIGSIAYFHDNDVLAIARFYAKVPASWGTQIGDVKLISTAGSKSKNAFRGKELELWDSDGNKDSHAAFNGFAMTGTIMFDVQTLTLFVPVSGDQIDDAGIKVSAGLEFEVIR